MPNDYELLSKYKKIKVSLIFLQLSFTNRIREYVDTLIAKRIKR